MKPFGKRIASATTVAEAFANSHGAEKLIWRDAMEWAGPDAVITPAMRETVAKGGAK